MDSVNDFEMNENGINEIRMNLGLSYLLPLLFVAHSFTPMGSVSWKSLKWPICKGKKCQRNRGQEDFQISRACVVSNEQEVAFLRSVHLSLINKT